MITECDDKTRVSEMDDSKNSIDSPPIKIVLNHSLFIISPLTLFMQTSFLYWTLYCNGPFTVILITETQIWSCEISAWNPFIGIPFLQQYPRSFPWCSRPWVIQTLPTAAASYPDHPSFSLNFSCTWLSHFWACSSLFMDHSPPQGPHPTNVLDNSYGFIENELSPHFL